MLFIHLSKWNLLAFILALEGSMLAWKLGSITVETLYSDLVTIPATISIIASIDDY